MRLPRAVMFCILLLAGLVVSGTAAQPAYGPPTPGSPASRGLTDPSPDRMIEAF
ncbi:hypothetical protein MNBD_PLANCTO03-905, partial [hydrothermal vent metagenome]